MQREGVVPTGYTVVSVVNACTQLLDLRRGKQIHGRIIVRDFGGNPFISNALTDMYAKCGEIAVASNEVHKFVANDRIHVDSIAIYKELDDLIKKVQEVGYKPSTNLVLHDVGEQEKLESISYHSEKLALAFMLMKRPHESMPVRILKNLRVCGDCHAFMKFSSKVTGRTIVLRDSNRFHHFVGGKCSCNDHW
ncbi:unnamed protein product [Linum tenue]|uniref:DYW domain-containing protein n=1 Tax=Linum tenue TaxID=586396 RepID=A0AAV0S958_9ROSI|nr:unnamed protein product [Linum tenue]